MLKSKVQNAPMVNCTLNFAWSKSYDFMYDDNNTLESAPYFSLKEAKLIAIEYTSGRYKNIQTIILLSKSSSLSIGSHFI